MATTPGTTADYLRSALATVIRELDDDPTITEKSHATLEEICRALDSEADIERTAPPPFWCIADGCMSPRIEGEQYCSEECATSSAG